MDPLYSKYEKEGVYKLITELCTRTAAKHCVSSKLSCSQLVKKMRSASYQCILKKTSSESSRSDSEPIAGLLAYYFKSVKKTKNVAEFKRHSDLKEIISELRNKDLSDSKDTVYDVLRLLVCLSDTVKDDLSAEMFKNPFSFGKFEEMLPRPPIENFGSPQPYSYYPSHVFELPYSLRNKTKEVDSERSKTHTEYTVESFESRSLIPDSTYSGAMEVKTFLSPMSLASLKSSHLSPYTDSSLSNYPRLTAPRDLRLPSDSNETVNVRISLPSTNTKGDLNQVNKSEVYVDIWEIANKVDKDIPENIWEIASKMSPVHERHLIAMSAREVALWRRVHEDQLANLDVVPERQFIRHIMYLIIGVETTTFKFDVESNCFRMKDDMTLEGISKEHLRGYVTDLLLVGTFYRRLFNFAFNQTLEDYFHGKGLVFEATRDVIRRYLLEFRLVATEIYEDCCKKGMEDVNCMPTLLQILYHTEPLKYEIETIASIYKTVETENKSLLPYGVELMSYLFDEISLVTHKKTANTMFNALFSVCKVYFKFIERFIFEGELDDVFKEFFIRKDAQYVNCRSKRYWDKGFHITQSLTVPDFLRPLAKCILLCGKSLRLLKLCNPSDPLVLLISSDHPSVKCCASFHDLSRQQQVLDVYRTRCLFVSGEPVTFEQILLKREAERKAFTEMASLKQAETMEKIVAERKRLAQLIIAEKQHSLRVLEAAMAEAKAAKSKSRLRDRRTHYMEKAAGKATEEVDSKLRDDERNKIMEYYSKLNIEVEKSKVHTEWKIRRLQLDQSRMQLLSTEERNLKREKLELEHHKNEVMAMSIRSDFEGDANSETEEKMSQSTDSVHTIQETDQDTEFDENKAKSQTSSDVFSAICNAAINFFGGSKTSEDKKCDNKKELDSQGNLLSTEAKEINSNVESKTSSDVIGSHLDNDNVEYLQNRQDALVNRRKVMAHEFGQNDNEMRPPEINFDDVDDDNNLQIERTANEEARRNKRKVLGVEYNLDQPFRVRSAGPNTDAHKEALANKMKVLGVEYNLPLDVQERSDPMNDAQEEAVRNRIKVLGSDGGSYSHTAFKGTGKRSGLTLNLNANPSENYSLGLTPNTGAVTPAEFPRLDLETPTTADVPSEIRTASDVFTPRSELDKDSEVDSSKHYLQTSGFNFSILVDDETVASEGTSVYQDADSVDNSPNKSLAKKKSSINFLEGTYSLEDFDPFGTKELRLYTRDHFTSKMDLEMATSPYTHPAIIMDEVQKKPYKNIFASHFGKDEDDVMINCDNIATLTACLQRSVMLPLTYQLEVVNNSILTYFLVDLDMYEHLRSLKDYFFLMDGEFSRSICHNLFSKLVKTINPQELLNFATLHSILDKALGSSISHVHKFSENLSFTITDPPLSFQHSSADVLQCLSLTYLVSWPLNIILSQEALVRYAKVFQFLVKMRRISWVLGEDFECLKLTVKLSKGRSRNLLRSPHYISIQLFRHIMASMIRALDNYIVTTCILSSWNEFESDLKKARTLDDLYECHVVYIKKVLFRCLLNNRSTPVMKLLNDIFTVILKFSRVLKCGEWRQDASTGQFTHQNYPQMCELFHLFEKLAKYLHKVVTRLMECGYQRHLSELLTMVNLNGYYDPERSKSDQSIQSP